MLVAAAAGACEPITNTAPASATPPAVTSPPVAASPDAGSSPSDNHLVVARAKDALPGITVKGVAPMTGYDRTGDFGPAWRDVDRNGCDTRNDILTRDLTNATFRPGTHDCVVIAGTLADPYSGTVVQFTKASAAAVQIDHLVPLAFAWQHGAQQWTQDQRILFANNPDDLQATLGTLNDQKGDAGPAAWLPPNKAYRCVYVARFTTVVADSGLWLDPANRDAIQRILAGC